MDNYSNLIKLKKLQRVKAVDKNEKTVNNHVKTLNLSTFYPQLK